MLRATVTRVRKPRNGLVYAVPLVDVMAVVWMIVAGDRLDRARWLNVVTLGGHHHVVLALAAVSFVVMAVLAVTTEGFRWLSGPEEALLALATLLTIIAVAGVLSVVVLVVGAGLLARLFLR